MRIEVKETGRILLHHCRNDQLFDCLHQMKKKRVAKMEELRSKVEQYEKRRAQEQAAYRNLSPWKRWMSGKTPDHHMAVEHMVYIKQPMREIERLVAAVRDVEDMIAKLTEEIDMLIVPSVFADEIEESIREEQQ